MPSQKHGQYSGRYPTINVEETFNEMVREYGGAIVLEDKLPHPRTFPNADYIFHSERIVAELKCLQDDNVHSENNQARINTVIDRYYNEGKITTKNIDEANWRDLPKGLTDSIYEIISNAIQGRIRKAKHQIRETKRQLGLDSYTGYLIIVNEGIFSLPPVAFMNAVIMMLDKQDDIEHFIFFTANIFTQIRNVPMPLLVWIGFDMQKGPTKLDNGFNVQLHGHWLRIYSRKTGVPHMKYESKDDEGFWKAKNIVPK